MQNRELFFTRNVQTQSGVPLRLEYYRLSRPTPPNIEYGAAVRCIRPEGAESASAENITVRPERIDALLRLLADAAVTPVTLYDVLEDIL